MRTTPLILSVVLLAGPTLAQVRAPTVEPATPWTSQGSPQSATDVALEYQLKALLGEQPSVDTHALDVTVVRGAVTFRGQVPSERVRTALLVGAGTMRGVLVVRDEMSLAPDAGVARGGGPRDAALGAQVQAVAASDQSVAPPGVRAEVEGGRVMLLGRVATYRDALRVLDNVRAVPGVTTVRSQLRIGERDFMAAELDRQSMNR